MDILVLLHGKIAPNLIKKVSLAGDLNGIQDKKFESCVVKNYRSSTQEVLALSTNHQLFTGVKLHFQQVKPWCIFHLEIR